VNFIQMNLEQFAYLCSFITIDLDDGQIIVHKQIKYNGYIFKKTIIFVQKRKKLYNISHYTCILCMNTNLYNLNILLPMYIFA